MNYEEALREICRERKYRDTFFEDREIKSLKNSIKKIGIQNENMKDFSYEEFYKARKEIKDIKSFLERNEEWELKFKRTKKELELREKKFVKGIINIVDNIKYIEDFSKRTKDETLKKAMENLLYVSKKNMMNLDILLIEGKESFFDENMHECVSTISNEEKKDYEINDVLSFGYIYKGKVERAAKVIVVKNKEEV